MGKARADVEKIKLIGEMLKPRLSLMSKSHATQGSPLATINCCAFDCFSNGGFSLV